MCQVGELKEICAWGTRLLYPPVEDYLITKQQSTVRMHDLGPTVDW